MKRPQPDTSRAAASAVLSEVLDRRQPLDAVLEASRALAGLEPRDRAFARAMVTTALRRLGQIDEAIRRCLERPLQPKARAARNLLRIGAAQLLFLRTPAHAAVDSTVSLASGGHLAPYRGLINAVLRRLAREGDDLLAEQDAVQLNLPAWLREPWLRDYGDGTVHAIADVLAADPPLDISVKSGPDEWAAKLGAVPVAGGSLRVAHAGGPVTELAGYDEGAWWVQDAAASLPARLLGDVARTAVVDLCAAPGGKTAQLAAAGAHVTAVDRSESRLQRLKQNLVRLRLDAELVAADVAAWRPRQPASRVLLDAPCSATGTLRRHPDIAWLKSQADVDRMAAMQDSLLDAAVAMLAPGGVLVYCVCSLQREEGPDRVAALLGRGAPMARQPIGAAEIGGLAEAITPDGDLRTLPSHLAAQGGMDGFYAARLVRKG
jgi:16S rRNA (cytosine967-C5)-methyltransferase